MSNHSLLFHCQIDHHGLQQLHDFSLHGSLASNSMELTISHYAGELKGNKKANDVMQGGIGELQGKIGGDLKGKMGL